MAFIDSNGKEWRYGDAGYATARAKYNRARGLCACSRELAEGMAQCRACKESASQSYRKRRANKLCMMCSAPTGGPAYCGEHRLHVKQTRDQIRYAAIDAYGGKCACPGCSETNKAFLCIDHIDGGGNKHRKSIGQSNFFRWLRQNNYPPGFQVLCANCNQAKQWCGGVCPHEWPSRLTEI